MLLSTSRRYAQRSLRNRLLHAAAVCLCVFAPAVVVIGELGGSASASLSAKIDTDADGIPNQVDNDIDGDGILNSVDPEVDGDGIANGADVDVDGDTLLNGDKKELDVDSDGIADNIDPDIDGDGLMNGADADVDGDGVLNGVDPDVDGDAIKNAKDPDIDGDGLVNGVDPDVDGDGILNGVDTDTDGDGKANNSRSEKDVDGDGIKNTEDPDVDGDGVLNGDDPDVDGDGINNATDPDIDGDGRLNGARSEKDIDGDGVLDAVDPDVDADGIANGVDDDIDGDGIANATDDDQDGDGVSNKRDSDANGDGTPDHVGNPNGSDSKVRITRHTEGRPAGTPPPTPAANGGTTPFATSILALVPGPALATSTGLQPFYTDVGNLTLSLDAVGTLAGTATVQVQKPADGTVREAFLFSASTGFTNYLPNDSDVTIDSQAVAWNNDWTRLSGISSYNVAADVTSLVSAKLSAAPAGTVDFTIGEANPSRLDGEVLAVIWQSPSARSRTITLLYGALATGGDNFAVNLGEPLLPSSTATMSLGISYGACCQPIGQYTNISVNGKPLTSSAGGQDDGELANGALITVGGIGDSTGNPADPLAHDDCTIAPRCDDELYDLKALVGNGATSFSVATNNPSNDDNIFLAALDIGTTASVSRGVLLTPGSVAHDTSTTHTMVARVQDASGATVSDGVVTATVVSGPNAGASITGIRFPDGEVVFTYSSSKVGTDAIRATYTGPDGVQQVSNIVTQRWFQAVAGTIGWAWPAPNQSVTLKYSYGGLHRYLGNVVQGGWNWNSTGTRLNFEPWAGGEEAIQVRIADAFTAEPSPNDPKGDAWATTQTWYPDSEFSQITILLYQRTLDPESDEQITKTVTHELGHAIGLDHTETISGLPPGTPSVMWQGPLSKTVRSTPQAIDISRVNGLYP